jgi:hypothetical protein
MRSQFMTGWWSAPPTPIATMGAAAFSLESGPDRRPAGLRGYSSADP